MARQRNAELERQWRERLKRFRNSEATVNEFCDVVGVSTATFYYWKRRLSGGRREAYGNGNEETPLFLPVTLRTVPAAAIRMELPGGAVVHFPPEMDVALVTACIRAACLTKSDEEASAC